MLITVYCLPVYRMIQSRRFSVLLSGMVMAKSEGDNVTMVRVTVTMRTDLPRAKRQMERTNWIALVRRNPARDVDTERSRTWHLLIVLLLLLLLLLLRWLATNRGRVLLGGYVRRSCC